MGQKQTVYTQIRHHIMLSDQNLHCLLTECSIKSWGKNEKSPLKLKLARPTEFQESPFGLKGLKRKNSKAWLENIWALNYNASIKLRKA